MTDEPQRSSPALPLYLLGPPIAAGAAAALIGAPPGWAALGLGALGWIAALALRTPLLMAARIAKLGPRLAGPGMVVASGPVEEGTRWAALAVLSAGPEKTIWLGIGWALAEAGLAAVNGVALRRALARDDAAGERARAALAAAGPLAHASAGWAALERMSVTAAHVGFGLWIVWDAWMVLPAAAAHSAMNAAAVFLLARNRSLVLVQGAVAAVGFGALLLGIALWS